MTCRSTARARAARRDSALTVAQARVSKAAGAVRRGASEQTADGQTSGRPRNPRSASRLTANAANDCRRRSQVNAGESERRRPPAGVKKREKGGGGGGGGSGSKIYFYSAARVRRQTAAAAVNTRFKASFAACSPTPPPPPTVVVVVVGTVAAAVKRSPACHRRNYLSSALIASTCNRPPKPFVSRKKRAVFNENKTKSARAISAPAHTKAAAASYGTPREGTLSAARGAAAGA